MKIKGSVIQNQKMTYALERKSAIQVDCAEGINNLLLSDAAVQALRSCGAELLSDYPHENGLRQAIVDWWRGSAALNDDMLLFGNGSQQLIYLVNKLLVAPGSRVLGFAPQYSSYCSDVLFCGGEYRAVRPGGSAAFHPDALLAELFADDTLVYIDNPNNPTGQLIPLDQIEAVVARAKTLGVAVLVDEAYGDYVPRSASAVTLLAQYDNLIVTRTFSKGFGLAGLRLGYLAAAPSVIRQLKKLTTPYDGSSVARRVCREVLKDEDFLPRLRQMVRCIKHQILAEPFARLRIAPTDPCVPIMAIFHPRSDFDLAEFLAAHGVAAVSGRSFYHMGPNMVRLRIPTQEDLPIVLEALRAADARE